jgi:hypothetical protein
MNSDYEAKSLKAGSLIRELSTFLGEQGIDSEDAKGAASNLLDLIISITPPEQEKVRMELVRASSYSGAGGGRSTKPGNIKINLEKLLGGLAIDHCFLQEQLACCQLGHLSRQLSLFGQV